MGSVEAGSQTYWLRGIIRADSLKIMSQDQHL